MKFEVIKKTWKLLDVSLRSLIYSSNNISTTDDYSIRDKHHIPIKSLTVHKVLLKGKLTKEDSSTFFPKKHGLSMKESIASLQ